MYLACAYCSTKLAKGPVLKSIVELLHVMDVDTIH